MNELSKRLSQEFLDKEYAHSYMEAHASSRMAAQIKVLREQRELTQAGLAELSGMKQERISTLENVDYDAWTVNTLRKLARAFDTHLHVSFVSFSEGIEDVVSLSRKNLEVESRKDDLEKFSASLLFEATDGKWQPLQPLHPNVVTTLRNDNFESTNEQWQLFGALKTA